MSKTNEVYWWTIFSMGGVLGALFLPVFVLLTGFILPFGELSSEEFANLHKLLGNWVIKIFLLVIFFSCFFHGFHRLRHTLLDLGLRPYEGPLTFTCYGLAFSGAAFAAYVLWIL